jgi:hypothetical protein
MFNVLPSDSFIALGGYGVGLVVGSLNNVRKTKSLFKIAEDAPNETSFLVRHLEVNRDRGGANKINTIGDFLIPRIWNPFVPLEHLLPLTVVLINQLFLAAMVPGATVTSTTILGAIYTFKIILLPICYNAAVFLGGALLRGQISFFTKKMRIDASGHAVTQSGSAIYKLFVFSALSQCNISSYLYRTTAAVTALSDYLWTYRTTSTYHTVMDMMVTTLFMGTSLSLFCAGHWALTKYAPIAFHLLAGKISILSPLETV